MSDLTRGLINALLPEGHIWTPKTDGDFDNLLDGIADNIEEVRAYLDGLADLRDPFKTTILSDLELEYGLYPNGGLTENERRQQLFSTKTAVNGDGSADFLEERLREAGFDVYVHINNPPIDPQPFLTEQFFTICGNETAICGREDAIAGGLVGDLVVNGPVHDKYQQYSPVVAGSELASCGTESSICGGIYTFVRTYEVPSDSGYWGLFFFVGGLATRSNVDGQSFTISGNEYAICARENAVCTGNVPTDEGGIVDIEIARVAAERRDELRRLVVKYKPKHSWGVMIIDYT